MSASGSDASLQRRGLGGARDAIRETARATADRVESAGGRVVYLDLLRATLVALVICVHSAIAVGGAQGGWYYILPGVEGIAPLLLTVFVAINQAFFMSLLFAISACFAVPAYDRKGPGAFLRDRFVRLGIPLLVWCMWLNQSVVFLSARFSGQTSLRYAAFLRSHWWAEVGSGPLWFVSALLVFTTLYALARAVRRGPLVAPGPRPLPGHGHIAAFVLAIGAVTFAVRLAYPVGREFLDLQLGHFPLYVCMFGFGIAARRWSWLEQLDEHARVWSRAVLASFLVMLPAMAAGGALEGDFDPFVGGPTWQSWLYCTWEALACVGISLGLLHLFRERCHRDGPLRARIARSNYTAYIIHPFFVVVGTWLLAASPLPALARFVLLCAGSVVLTWAVSDYLRRLPGVRRVV